MSEPVALRSAPAAERNFEPILGVLRHEFSGATRVLEIGAGTGQHAAGFAAEMPWLSWLPTDQPESIAGIEAWCAAVALANLEAPIALDVIYDAPPDGSFDAAYSANTAHIMDEPAVGRMFDIVGAALLAGGRFCLYGPFRENGCFSTESNERFDASLRRSDPAMGIRDIEALDAEANRVGLGRIRRYAMPGNNLVLVFERENGEARAA